MYEFLSKSKEFSLDHNITKILFFPILSPLMNSIFHREETDERGIASARRDTIPDDRVYP